MCNWKTMRWKPPWSRRKYGQKRFSAREVFGIIDRESMIMPYRIGELEYASTVDWNWISADSYLTGLSSDTNHSVFGYFRRNLDTVIEIHRRHQVARSALNRLPFRPCWCASWPAWWSYLTFVRQDFQSFVVARRQHNASAVTMINSLNPSRPSHPLWRLSLLPFLWCEALRCPSMYRSNLSLQSRINKPMPREGVFLCKLWGYDDGFERLTAATWVILH